MRVIAIIQARMNSSRLPGKVLKDIAGRPMLGWVIQRARRAHLVNEVMVATTDDSSDDPIETYCQENGVALYRGSQFDVLDRYYQAACQAHADVVVRITADCPLIDPGVVDQTIEVFWREEADFAANRLPPPWHRTYPIGLDTEVVSFAALERAWKEAMEPFEREHVMPYLYDQEERFKVAVINHDPDYGAMRWTVDTAEDLDLLRRIFVAFPDGLEIEWTQVVDLFAREPELAEINASVHHKTVKDVDGRADPTAGK
jgi:spore coat polysaccharide biosynthesis protein SpsF